MSIFLLLFMFEAKAEEKPFVIINGPAEHSLSNQKLNVVRASKSSKETYLPSRPVMQRWLIECFKDHEKFLLDELDKDRFFHHCRTNPETELQEQYPAIDLATLKLCSEKSKKVKLK